MQHINTLSLRDADRLALDHARSLWDEHANGPRLEDPPAPPSDPAPANPPADPPADPAPANPPADPPTPQPNDDGSFPAAYVQELRQEAAGYRTKLRDVETKQQQTETVLQGIAKALGIGGDDEPDPAQLQATVAEKDATIRALKVDGALRDAATKHNADYELTAAVLARGNKLNNLDPDGDDFSSSLDELVKTTVETNPKLKASQAPPSSGAPDFPGGSGGDKKATDLTGALANHYAS